MLSHKKTAMMAILGLFATFSPGACGQNCRRSKEQSASESCARGSALLQLHRSAAQKTADGSAATTWEERRATLPTITIADRQLLVDGVPVHLKGVNWNPVKKGGYHPWGLDFPGFMKKDVELMRAAGINAVRTHVPLTDRDVLDYFWDAGIWVLNTVYSWGGAAPESVAKDVNAVKDHPAVLMWSLGNEWNYNMLYVKQSERQTEAKIRAAAAVVKQHDPTRPVSTVYGELPSSELIRSMPHVDIWGINIYREKEFGSLFNSWVARSHLPMYVAEYGADAFDARVRRENQEAQAEATTVLTKLIMSESAVSPTGTCLGGFVFEFADEWWKDDNGSPRRHDRGGIAPGGGPYPDKVFNEEWWGLVDIDRKPRLAYAAYAALAAPVPAEPTSPPNVPPVGTPTEDCHTAVAPEKCHGAVQWAMTKGVRQNPEWYPGLNASSRFEEFQSVLHAGQHHNCSKPCPPCHTAVAPEPCYKEVQWAMATGIRQNPEWYPDLSASSSFEEFQALLHAGKHHDCPRPCAR